MKIVIIEDEPVAARLLAKMLTAIEGVTSEGIDICGSVEDANARLAEKVDLVFLDLNLMGRSGFEILEAYAAEPFEVIITTAYAEHALKAFEYGVRDYLLKPISQARLEQAIARIPSVEVDSSPALQVIVVKERGAIIPVAVEEMVCIRSAGDYTELRLIDGAVKLSARRMEFLEQRLPDDFIRVHRSAIVRVSKIRELLVEPGGKYGAVIDGINETIPIGRKYYKDVKKRLGEE